MITDWKILVLSLAFIMPTKIKALDYNRNDSIIMPTLPKLGQMANTPKKKKNNNENDKTPRFIITSTGFTNTQDPNRPFIVFEFTDFKAKDLKSAIISRLTTMFSSPQDVISEINDNIVTIEGYSNQTFFHDKYPCDILFNLTIEFKDGKIRYNNPVIKQIYIDSGIIGKLRMDNNKTFYIIAENNNELKVANYFNSIVSELNIAIRNANDW